MHTGISHRRKAGTAPTILMGRPVICCLGLLSKSGEGGLHANQGIPSNCSSGLTQCHGCIGTSSGGESGWKSSLKTHIGVSGMLSSVHIGNAP